MKLLPNSCTNPQPNTGTAALILLTSPKYLRGWRYEKRNDTFLDPRKLPPQYFLGCQRLLSEISDTSPAVNHRGCGDTRGAALIYTPQ